jgi:starch phosphorylase
VVSEARTLDRFIVPIQERLWALARNLWWSWDPDSTSLFLDLDPIRWRELHHNPVALLSEIPLEEIERRAEEQVLHSRINYAYRRLREYLENDHTWGTRHAGILRPRPVGYFSAEFGLHESIPIYSGGLGILAGDHLKSSSDLDIPLVGVGLFYGQGYFRQRLDRNGWQQEEYLETDVNQLPMERAIGANGEPVMVQIETRSGVIRAKVWRFRVGRRDSRKGLAFSCGTPGSVPARFECRWKCSRRSRPQFALVWRRPSHPNSSRAAAGRRGVSRAAGYGHYSRRSALERGPQWILRSRGDSVSNDR